MKEKKGIIKQTNTFIRKNKGINLSQNPPTFSFDIYKLRFKIFFILCVIDNYNKKTMNNND